MIKRLLEKSLQYSKSITTSLKYSNIVLPPIFPAQFFHIGPTDNYYSPMDPSLTPSTVIQVDDDEIRLRAHKLCANHLGGSWASISPFQISVIPVSGGMSNSLFCCSLPESDATKDGGDEPSQVLLRFYGDQTRNCDISIQLEIFNLLSMKKLGPKLYGKFEDGRLEEFLPANSLTCEELTNSEISSIIAKKLATVHNLDVPIDRNEIWLLERYNEWIKFIEDEVKVPTLEAAANRQSTIDIAQELLAIDFRKELEFMREIFGKSQSPIVFSHNDLHQGNILLAKYSNRRPTLEERLFIIDFEYCSYNYRAYDIANHFCEWCFEYDTPEYPHFNMFEDKFPSLDAQYKFVNHYSEQWRKIESDSSLMKPRNDNNNHQCTNNNSTNGRGNTLNIHKPNINIKRDETAITHEDSLLEEIKPFFMAANLLWTLWCIRSAKSSTIKFGYWEHAMARWKLYSGFKLIYLK